MIIVAGLPLACSGMGTFKLLVETLKNLRVRNGQKCQCKNLLYISSIKHTIRHMVNYIYTIAYIHFNTIIFRLKVLSPKLNVCGRPVGIMSKILSYIFLIFGCTNSWFGLKPLFNDLWFFYMYIFCFPSPDDVEVQRQEVVPALMSARLRTSDSVATHSSLLWGEAIMSLPFPFTSPTAPRGVGIIIFFGTPSLIGITLLCSTEENEEECQTPAEG